MDHLVLEVGLALALIAAAALLSVRFRFSIVPLLILFGMVVGPHAPHIGPLDLRFLNSAPIIAFMGRLGVLFLLFYLGLEFSVGRLIRAGRSIVMGGTIYMAINFPLGLLLGWVAGWPFRESLLVAGIISISSSAIVAKLLVELKRTANPETEMILGIMMYQDVFVAVYLSVLSGLVLSTAASLGSVIVSVALALGFMLGFILLGRKAVPWLNRALNLAADETFLLVLLAALLLVAGFSEVIHIAEAIGALLLGLVMAETEHRERIERLVLPFRDLFGAFFFFHFGLSIDPFGLGGAAWLSLAAVALTLGGNILSGLIVGRRAGLSSRASSYLGVTVISRGEFSIILADLAAAGGLLPALQPFSALYVVILAVLGPLLTRHARAVHNLLNRLTGQKGEERKRPVRRVPEGDGDPL